jgi:hypothetical protein
MNASFSTHACAPRRAALRKLALVAAVGVCAAAVSAAALADEQTTGRVFGNAPAGSTVLVSSADFGIRREVPVNGAGRYVADWLPIGVYTVTAMASGKPLVEHSSVPVLVDRGSRVDFNCVQGQCSQVAQW